MESTMIGVLLTVANVRKEFANEIVLDSVDLRVERRDKVAIVGRNGAGKTTLLKILTREYEPDAGSVQWSRGASVGYLSQQSTLDDSMTVLESAEDARRHLVELETRLKELELQIEQNPTEEDLDEYSLLHEHFHAEGGYSLDRDLKSVLAKMGFEEDEYNKPVRSLSGGERTRLILARLILEEPDLLILDEPTNHLDLEATEWLENWIRSYHGAVLVVSHDRTFLDSISGRVVEIRDGKTKAYPGPFEKYLLLRAEDEARQADLAKLQQKEIEKMDEYVRRFMNSQRTAQARGRLKQMEKLKSVAVQAPVTDKGIAGGFQVAKRAGDIVAECKDLSMAFGSQRLFQHLDWTVRWGDRWGVIGMNGAGKSTLMKVMLGRIAATAGQVRIGSNVEVGYFSQDATDLDLELSPMMYLNDVLRMELGAARSLLGRFLISGEDAIRPMRTLSGGERNKMQLAVLTAQAPNVLILDEPTNHLDMASREALASVLNEFNGTIILVSHDRWLLDQVTKQTLDLRIGDYRTFGGSYGEYRRFQNRETSPAVTKSATKKPAEVEKRMEPTMSPRELSKLLSKLEKEVIVHEETIAKLESNLAAVESKMAKPKQTDDVVALSHEYGAIRSQIDAAIAAWESISLQIDELRQQQGTAV